jgi:NAD-specific glutamate dehydrogenase
MRSPRCSKAAPRTTSFNRLIVEGGMRPDSVVLFRAWFRYLRQTGMNYGMAPWSMRCAARPPSPPR